MLYYPHWSNWKFQKFVPRDNCNQIRNTTWFLPLIKPELIYCWEQLKISIFRGFSTQIQEHLAMGVLLSLGAHHVLFTLSDSKQSLISRCYNLMIRTWNKSGQQQRWRGYLYMICFHILIICPKRGISFQSSILDDVRLNNTLSIQTTIKTHQQEIARKMDLRKMSFSFYTKVP